MQNIIKTCLFILGLWSFPSLAEERPEAFLSGLLTTDFVGEYLPRRDKVIYTDGKYMLGDDCCEEPRENFEARFSSLFIITNWQIVNTKILPPFNFLIV
jgi:hypothetical protein